MKINIRNNADLSNKYIRFVKWKTYQLQEKFNELIYVEIFLKSEGQSPKKYFANIRLGIPGKDIIIKEKSGDLGRLFQNVHRKMNYNLAKNKKKKIKRRIDFLQNIQPISFELA